MAGNSLDTYVMDLRARTAKLETDLDKANKKIRAKMSRSGKMMSKDMTAMFAKVGAALGVTVGIDQLRQGILGAVQAGSQLQTTADKLGLTTDALQELRYAGDQFNVQQNTTDMALQRFGRRVAEAAQGTGELKSTLDQYNISTRDSQGNTRSLMAVLGDFADVLAGLDDVNEQNRISMKAFDSEGVAFGAVMRAGAAGLAEFQNQAHLFGQVIEIEAVQRLAQVDKQLKRVTGGFKSFFAGMVAGGLNMTDQLGITGLEAELKKVNEDIRQVEELNATGGRGFGRAFAGVGVSDKDISVLKIQQRAILDELLNETVTTAKSMEATLQDAFGKLDLTPKGSEDWELMNARVFELLETSGEWDQKVKDLVSRYPQLAGAAQQLTATHAEMIPALSLTATETSQLASILNSTETDAEKFRAKIEILGKAIQAQPERIEEFKEAIERLGKQYMESLEPDKMDKLLEAWEGMSQGMSSSLSNALLEGEQGLDGFLSRMLNKLASAALEAAIVAPFLNMLGMGGVGGGLIGGIGSILGFADGGSPPVGVPSIVGERGPELFVPKVAGTIIPNHAMAGGGGSTVFNIKQDLHFDVGLESVDSRIASAAPIIAQATEAQILDKQRRGRR
jgi:hypothetical protein